MTDLIPVIFQWNGIQMVPLERFDRLCTRQFVIGQTYKMEIMEERSANSHAHYFASVHDAWKNLPEKIAPRFPTPDHLRRWALIKANFADERIIPARTLKEAQIVAAVARGLDGYAVIKIEGDDRPPLIDLIREKFKFLGRAVDAICRFIEKYDDELAGPVVHIWTAKSQKHNAMDKETFQRSKSAVLEIVSELIGVSTKTLDRETGKSA